MDYIKKLSKKDLEYLNQFMAEYVSGAFKKNDDGEYSKDNMHKTAEERRECYTRNNVRNRCGLTVSNATGKTLRSECMNNFIDSITNSDEFLESTNKLSDLVFDEYEGDYSLLEKSIEKEMFEDYKKCINPRTPGDRKMLNSNYGKMLILKFNNTKSK